MSCRVLVLISGNGSNLQALIDQTLAGQLDISICAVISNRSDAPGLARAAEVGIACHYLPHQQRSREQYDRELLELVTAVAPDLVVLAGFMRILTPIFVNPLIGRLINIHPSLLPRFRGLNTHMRAIAEGASEHGASVHFVTSKLDAGPIIAQIPVPVLPGDTPERLQQYVHQAEHHLYPTVVSWFADNRLRWIDSGPRLDNRKLPPTGIRLTSIARSNQRDNSFIHADQQGNTLLPLQWHNSAPVLYGVYASLRSAFRYSPSP